MAATKLGGKARIVGQLGTNHLHKWVLVTPTHTSLQVFRADHTCTCGARMHEERNDPKRTLIRRSILEADGLRRFYRKSVRGKRSIRCSEDEYLYGLDPLAGTRER